MTDQLHLSFQNHNLRGQQYDAVVQQKIFDVLCEHPYGLTGKELVDKVYGDRPDGGPLNANSCLTQTIMRMRLKMQRIAPFLTIRSLPMRAGRRYMLIIRRP